MMPGVETGHGSRAASSNAVPDWDVKSAETDSRGFERVNLVIPTISKLMGNVVGGSAVLGGLALGKAWSQTTSLIFNDSTSAVDTSSFRMGLRAFMVSNGIVPEIVVEEAAPEVVHSLLTAYPETADVNSLWSTPVIISNHVCYLDGVVLAACMGAPRVVALAESKNVPLVGKILEEMDTIFVDRSNGDSRQATVRAIGEHCSEWRSGGRPLVIFPEGQTSNGGTLLPLKKGAFTPGLPVRPVLIVYTGDWDPACTSFRQTRNGDLEKVSEAEWAAQFMGHFVPLQITVLAPYVPSAAERQDPELYASNVQALMALRLQELRRDLIYQGRPVTLAGEMSRRFADGTKEAISGTREAWTGTKEALLGTREALASLLPNRT